MKIIYILKKGLQAYPPCLAQVLTINDLKYDLEIYHGDNSPYIDSILDNRGITHHTFHSDRNNKNTLESALGFILFCAEVKRITASMDSKTLLWIGNMETAMALDKDFIKNRKVILNVLELYNERTIYDRWLKKNIKYLDLIVSCEKHRAAIMQSRYALKELPEVIPNKPYSNNDIDVDDNLVLTDIINLVKDNFTIVYQGIISKDRPLEKLAKTLSLINDETIWFLIIGDCSDEFKSIITGIYPRTVFTGYIPAPIHLQYTKYCNIGIANYDTSSLNNVFCAPNKIYEYAKYGIPTICSNNISLKESVGSFNAGLCVDFRSELDIKQAIEELRKHYSDYSKNSICFYNSFSLEESISKILQNVEGIHE